jgi:hypothetical protein
MYTFDEKLLWQENNLNVSINFNENDLNLKVTDHIEYFNDLIITIK